MQEASQLKNTGCSNTRRSGVLLPGDFTVIHAGECDTGNTKRSPGECSDSRDPSGPEDHGIHLRDHASHPVALSATCGYCGDQPGVSDTTRDVTRQGVALRANQLKTVAGCDTHHRHGIQQKVTTGDTQRGR